MSTGKSNAAKWRVFVAGLTVVSLVSSPAVPVWSGPASAPAPLACGEVAQSAVTATAMAVACGREVAVGSSRSEFTQVVATAQGRLRFESAVVPQRARRADGLWADVDLTLVSTGGVVRPRVSVADVAFSAGGSGPMVTMRRSGKALTLSWPQALPSPSLSGDTATYRNVLPDVDLVIRATRAGFSHVLAVKSAAAAANPAVRTIRLGVGGDAGLHAAADGSMRAMAGSTVVASATPAVMWDSSEPAGGRSAAGASSAREAGDAARVRRVAVEVEKKALVLRADEAMLSAGSAFPVFIDPAWSVGEGSGQKWAYATDNGSNNTDYSVARVGKNPDTGVVFRSFFEFPTSNNGISLQGKHIQSAYVQMHLYHSHACSDKWNYMYLTPAINATMRASWNAMSLSSWLSAQYGHANKGTCPGAPQPDQTMNFQGSAVTNQVQVAANDGWSAITIGFAALDTNDGSGESTIDRWMKYIPDDAKLIVDYDSRPTAPHSLQVSGVACPASGPVTVGTLTPTVSAIHPDEDSTQTLTAGYEWIEVPAAGIGTVTDTYPARKGTPFPVPVSAGGRAETAAFNGLAKAVTYAARTRSTDSAPYNITGPWSAWCQFKVDDTVPQVSVAVVTAPAGPGKPGSFRITSTSGDVTTFKYGWGSATTAIAATGNPRSATVALTAPRFGMNLLHVSAVDTTLNEGFGSVEFTVGRPSPAVAKWGLETYPGVDQTAALADRQPGLAGNTPLTATNLTWSQGVRMVGGGSAHFEGVDGATGAKTEGPVVNTSQSFSVSAWARPGTCASGLDAVASAGGVNNAAFVLERVCDAGYNKWRFIVYKSDVAPLQPGWGVWEIWSTATITEGRWYHLAAAYDSVEREIRLYVDGILQGTQQVEGIFQAGGPFVVGAAKSREAYVDWYGYRGELADVQVFDRVLVGHDLIGQRASDPQSGGFNEPGILTPIQAGGWDFGNAVPCYVTDLRDTCEAGDNTGWDRWLSLTRGAQTGSGRDTSGVGLWLDNRYFPDEGYNEPSVEFGQSATKTGVTPPDENGFEYTTWQKTPVLRTDQSFTVSAWVNLSAFSADDQATVVQEGVTNSAFWLGAAASGGKARWRFMMPDTDSTNPGWRVAETAVLADSALGRWTHLVAVYDSVGGWMRLYVGGVLHAYTARSSATAWHATGPLTVGHALKNGSRTDGWKGGIDDISVFQGAMSEADVAARYGPGDPGLGMMSGTSPAIAAAPSGGYRIAFQANTGNLWTVDSSGASNDIGVGMMAGTNPAIAYLSDGTYQIAFHANTGKLWTYHSSGQAVDTGLFMKSGTSPSIAATPTGGGYRVAFQGSDTDLWVYNGAGGWNDIGLGMKSGTNPAIVFRADGSYQVAFHANTGKLWKYNSTAGAVNTDLSLAPGTSPAIAAAPSAGSYWIAFQGADSDLRVYDDSGGLTHVTLGMMPGTSPAIAAWPSGIAYRIAIQTNLGTLWTFDSSGSSTDTSLVINAGTSPAMTGSLSGYKIAFQAGDTCVRIRHS